MIADTFFYDISIPHATDETLPENRVTLGSDQHPYEWDIARPQYVTFRLLTKSISDAIAIVSAFPTSLRLKAYGCCGNDNGSVALRVSVAPDGVNKGANETGIKRMKSFQRVCAKLGYAIEQADRTGGYVNRSPLTLADYGWTPEPKGRTSK